MSANHAVGRVEAVVFDVGRVLVQWDLRALFAKLIEDSQALDWFCSNVVTEDWHFEHDAGREDIDRDEILHLGTGAGSSD